MTFDYDLFVIGGGSGGVRAARIAAAETGAKVALAEMDRYGGTCVIRGCVPKKLMVFASEFANMPRDAAAYGWSFAPGSFDWNRFRGRLETELERLERIYRELLSNSGVETFDQQARLVDPHTVELADGSRKVARHILVATGGHPVKPELPGADLAVTSNEIFHLPELPGKMLIVGGGYIACEFASIMNGLGVEVTQYYRGSQILRGFDDDARDLIAEEAVQSGIDLKLGVNVARMSRQGNAVRVTATDGDTRVFDRVMFATGRAPNSKDLGLEGLNVPLGSNGRIMVDDYSQTVIPSVYAIGDVTDRMNLTPVAIREGMAFVDTVFRGNPTPIDHRLVATAVFTRPELGAIGLPEAQAAQQEKVDIYSARFRPMRSGFAGRSTHALTKLVVSCSTRRILGCHIVAPDAGEMIQLAAVALRMGATKEDFDRTVAVHPTISEEIVTMRHATRTA